jgi:stress-induced morphogen
MFGYCIIGQNFCKNNKYFNKILFIHYKKKYNHTKQNQINNNNKSIQKTIEEKLKKKFLPSHIEIINESFMHNVPKGSETHFKLIIVSEKFENISLLERHKQINETLREEFTEGPLHALSIHPFTPSIWEKSLKIPHSPVCLGGKKNEKENV